MKLLQSKCSWCLLSSLIVWLNFYAPVDARAAVILDYDNRTVGSAGFGRVDGYYGEWNEADASTSMFTPYSAIKTAGVAWFDLPNPPHVDNDFFTLTGRAAQTATAHPSHFSATGSVLIDTGDNNSTLGAEGMIATKSLFDMGFTLDSPYRADFGAVIEMTSLPDNMFSAGVFSSSGFLGLWDIDHGIPVFEHRFDESDLFINESISTSYHLGAGSYALVAGVSSVFAFSGYADICDFCGGGKYNFNFALTSVPEPTIAVLLAIGLVGFGLRNASTIRRAGRD